jgi:hypothetical protein
MSSDRPQLMDFPCEFIIKVMGKNTPSFEGAVLKILKEYVPDLSEGAISLRESKENNFLAMTITFNATSQEQIDLIYTALSANEEIIMAL